MIARAVLALGLVWLMAPHQPDLGLTRPASTSPCASCDTSLAGEQARSEIFQRLRQIRAELHGGEAFNPVVSTRREAALQNAGRLPAMPGVRLTDVAPQVRR